jgi:hypothetical protein
MYGVRLCAATPSGDMTPECPDPPLSSRRVGDDESSPSVPWTDDSLDQDKRWPDLLKPDTPLCERLARLGATDWPTSPETTVVSAHCRSLSVVDAPYLCRVFNAAALGVAQHHP